MTITTPLTHGMPSLVLLSTSTESGSSITHRVVLIIGRGSGAAGTARAVPALY